MTAYHALNNVQKQEPDYKEQLAAQKAEEALEFIRNLEIFSKRCGYEVLSNIVLRHKKSGKIYSKTRKNS